MRASSSLGPPAGADGLGDVAQPDHQAAARFALGDDPRVEHDLAVVQRDLAGERFRRGTRSKRLEGRGRLLTQRLAAEGRQGSADQGGGGPAEEPGEGLVRGGDPTAGLDKEQAFLQGGQEGREPRAFPAGGIVAVGHASPPPRRDGPVPPACAPAHTLIP